MVECGGWIEESHSESNFVFLSGGHNLHLYLSEQKKVHL